MIEQGSDVRSAMDDAVRRHQAGDLRSAEAIYRRILTINPRHARALHMLGVIATQVGQNQVALDLIGRAIAIDPNDAEFHSNLGQVLLRSGKTDEALEAMQRSLSLNPDSADAHYNLGVALQTKCHWEQAIESYRQSLTLRPKFPIGWYILGRALHSLERLDEAEAAYRQAASLGTDFPEALCDLGTTAAALGRIDDAIAAYERAIAQRPDLALAHNNLSLLLLLKGDFERGWQEHEWRWRAKEVKLIHRRFSQPRWDGSDLHGQRILIHCEQGFGDTIHFIRYAPMIAERGGRIILETHSVLVGLLRNIPGIEQLVIEDEKLPPFDVHCAIQSLPMIFRTALDTIPASIPYIHPDLARSRAWRDRLPQGGDLRVGLVWAGRSTHDNDRNRSLALGALTPLTDTKGVCFYSLQKGDAAAQACSPPLGMPLIDWTSDLHDFSDTAALIDNLDLVIAVDTSVAHLAGAMGKPVWVLLPFIPDWRWMLDRTDSPWYPTMKLFRQPAPGDWRTTVEHVAAHLRKLAD